MYSLLHVHSHYSTLDGYGSPKQNAKRAKELGLNALSITDHGSISGIVEHIKACKEEGIKPIVGIELYVPIQSAKIKNKENKSCEHMVIWAKNYQGWETLMRIVRQTCSPEYFYYKPRISLQNYTDEDGKFWPGLEHFLDGNVFGMSGHQGTRLSNSLFCTPEDDLETRRDDLKKGYSQYKDADSPEYYNQFLKENWLEDVSSRALELEKMFGQGNFFIELQDEYSSSDRVQLLVHPVIKECLRKVSDNTGIPAVASSDPHYPSVEDAKDQRALVMINMKRTVDDVEKELQDPDNLDTMVFFGSDNFYIKSHEEMLQKFSEDEIRVTNDIANQIEEFDVTHKPIIPEFNPPKVKYQPYMDICQNDSDRYLIHLCVEGAKKIAPWENSDFSKEEYWDRLKKESKVIFDFGLSDYMLDIWDICQACDNRPSDHSYDWRGNKEKGGDIDPVIRGRGRGSAAGSLMSYLLGITGVDPFLYGLIFERFLNKGRFTEGHWEPPDIDLDIEKGSRDWVVEYIKHNYGDIYPMITFGRLQGRASVKDLFRVNNVPGGYELANEVCKHIPDEAAISDEIEQVKQSGEEYGIIRWALDHSEELQKYYEDESLKPIFDQAIRLEGKKRNQGKHASGYIIPPEGKLFPVAYDTHGKQRIVGVEMKQAEQMGLIKIDLLGLSTLTKLKQCQELIND